METLITCNRDFPFGFLPTTSVGLFRDFLPSPQVCNLFSGPPTVFLWHRGRFVAVCALPHAFPPPCENTSSVVSSIPLRLLSLFLHPDNTVANLRRSIAFRMSRNNSRGIATSAIWKTIFREWRTTFAPILISFSRNVVSVQ